MSIAISRRVINGITITPVVANGNEPNLERIKGSSYIPSLYANIFICAKKKSGKTNVIHTLLKNIVETNTKVYIFASTVHKDPTWQIIQDMLAANDIEFEAHSSFLDDDGSSMIPSLLRGPEPEEPEEEDEGDEGDEQQKLDPWDKVNKELAVTKKLDVLLTSCRTYDRGFCWNTHEIIEEDKKKEKEEKRKRRKKAPKYDAPDIVMVFDDLGQDLRHNSISQLLKTNRHHKAKVILSSQWITDLHPQAIKQLDFCLLFKSFSEDKLNNMHELLDLGNSKEEFSTLYHFATALPYNFLYIDVRNENYRRNFNEAITATTE